MGGGDRLTRYVLSNFDNTRYGWNVVDGVGWATIVGWDRQIVVADDGGNPTPEAPR